MNDTLFEIYFINGGVIFIAVVVLGLLIYLVMRTDS